MSTLSRQLMGHIGEIADTWRANAGNMPKSIVDSKGDAEPSSSESRVLDRDDKAKNAGTARRHHDLNRHETPTMVSGT